MSFHNSQPQFNIDPRGDLKCCVTATKDIQHLLYITMIFSKGRSHIQIGHERPLTHNDPRFGTLLSFAAAHWPQ